MEKVEGHPNYKKNEEFGLVIDDDSSAYSRYIQQKKSFSKIEQMENDINSINEDIKIIKELLLQLTQKN